ncbi:metalloregulator ArsR/SmtB family transcription factor [Uliginosibacterium sp. H3]|uniref:Metalloregulator ArsR/SmtB family transcription factor n=1 Tax=Uliginosibacterium silvisoli TaxID=3114758 RepID=A0ABU6K1N6_9RHOO|nr:metalloregulator ArsR/SmtB family transcription factor [Uliginosibacterium sp. H3]
MDEYKTSQLDAVFGAVADPTRRAILARLAQADARVTELAGDFPISLNSVSKHIRMLERAGLVSRTVSGRDHVLSLNARPMSEAADWMDFYRQFWEQRLAALEAFVRSRRKTASAAEKPADKPVVRKGKQT